MELIQGNGQEMFQRMPVSSQLHELGIMLEDLAIERYSFFEIFGIKTESFNELSEDLSIFLWICDGDNTIVQANTLFQKVFGACLNKPCYRCLMGKDRPCSCCPTTRNLEGKKPLTCKLCRRNEHGYDMNIFHAPVRNRHGNKYIIRSSFHVDISNDFYMSLKAKQEIGANSTNIQVMCSSCQKVREGENHWVRMKRSILNFLEVKISHGICPDCVRQLYPHLKL